MEITFEIKLTATIDKDNIAILEHFTVDKIGNVSKEDIISILEQALLIKKMEISSLRR